MNGLKIELSKFQFVEQIAEKLQLLKLLIADIMTVQGHYMFLGNLGIV